MESGTFDTILFTYENVQSLISLNTGGTKQGLTAPNLFLPAPAPTTLSIGFCRTTHSILGQSFVWLSAPSVSVSVLSSLALPTPPLPKHNN